MTRHRVRRWTLLVVGLGAMTLLLWQCTAAFDAEPDTEAIDVFGPWLADDAESFAAVLADFTERTGIPVNYTGSSDFDSDLRQRVTRGLEMPEIAVIPQPGLIAELFVRGLVVPLSDPTVVEIVENYPISTEELAVDGVAFLAPYRTNVKSLVWYRPDVFDANGWTIPDTLDDLHELVDEIAESDIAPWCFSIESGSSTGWAITDWIEDLLLRRSGPDVYDQWISSDLPFTDEAIAAAVDEFDDLVLAPGRTVGGAQRVLGESVADASRPLFDAEPGCAMYRQANFATAWFPDDITVGEQVEFFVLPGVDGEPPLLRGGGGLIQFSDRAEVNELMTFLVSVDGADAWLQRGNYLSGRDTIAVDDHAEEDRPFARLMLEADVQRFDASDTFQSRLRDTWLGSLTAAITETGRLDRVAGLDEVLRQVDEVRLELGDSATADAAVQAEQLESSRSSDPTSPADTTTDTTTNTTEEEAP